MKFILKKKIYEAESIEVAEFAKVFENTQRDLNISLINELSIICNKMRINTKDVINAGANILVSGTTIFKENNGNIKKNIETLKEV